MEEKNFIFFIIISVGIFLLWSMFLAPKPKKRTPQEGVTAGDTLSREAARAADKAGKTTAPDSTDTSLTPIVPADDAGEEPVLTAFNAGPTVHVVTDVYDVEFAGRGGAPTHWKLIKYPKEKCFPRKVEIAWPPLVKDPACDPSPVDLLDPDFATERQGLMSNVTVDGEVVKMDRMWTPVSDDLFLADGDSVGEMVFQTTLGDGRTLKKIYRFGKSRYDVDLIFKVEGQAPKTAGVDISLFYRFAPYLKSGVPRWNFNGPIAHNGRALKQFSPKDVIEEGDAGVKLDAVEWAGVTDDYFLSAVLASEDSKVQVLGKYVGSEENREAKKTAKDIWVLARVRPSEQDLKDGIAARMKVFMGPKDKTILKPVLPSLEFSIDYGMLKPLVMPLITALVYIDKLIGNYGATIIVLTVILRMAMFPLTRKGQKSMKQMTKLQPEIQKIREMYPDDKMKQNEEMQQLWKRNKINPAMGCLPMLLQMPVFFAFYKALLISIELRQAPFALWIIDLSARDPLYIWPVLMGGTQLITQKLTPSQMDPMQQKIFLAMPIVFMYILRDFPSGLLVYWTVSNIVGIAQQLYVNRQPD